jgi:hypothetical protein
MGNPRLTTMSNAAVHLDHRTMDNVAFKNPRIQCGLNVTFDDDPQLSKLVHTIWLQTYLNLQPTELSRRKATTSLNSFVNTPSDHFKISNHETIQRPTVMNITRMKFPMSTNFQTSRSNLCSCSPIPKTLSWYDLTTAEERRRRRRSTHPEHVGLYCVHVRLIRSM